MKILSVIQGNTYATGVSAADFSEYLKMTYANDTATIDLSLNAAVQYVEGILWMNFVNKSLKLIADGWDDGEYELPINGTLSTTVITYYDTNNTIQTLSVGAGELWLEQVDEQNSILHLDTASLPELYDRKDAIKVTMALTATDSTIPSIAIELIYQIGAYFYDCRVNDKAADMSIVERLASGLRMKVY